MIISPNQKQREGESECLALRLTLSSRVRRFFLKESFPRVHPLTLDFILHFIGQLCHMTMLRPILDKESGMTTIVLDLPAFT